jgi:glycosyltransferase involved in cell wall biosynthesis
LLTNWLDPWLWARAAESGVKQILGSRASEIILDAHFLYPDGAAAVILGRCLGLPVVITARGSDVNVKAQNAVMRRWIRWSARNCSAIVTVSQALADSLGELGIVATVLEVLPNGVDLDKFRPQDRDACRAEFGLSGKVVVSVGHLVPEKGHQIAIEAIVTLPDVELLIVGEGPERASLERQAHKLGVERRVRFLGLVPHRDMAKIYNLADALVLPSLREGMPNVILESIACGTRVVATDVGGIGEVIVSPVAGRLMRERTAAALSEALAAVLSEEVPVARIRAFAERFGWSAVIDRQLALYRRVLDPQRKRT